MRKRLTQDGLTVNAIAGTHVVMLGLDLSDSARKECLGFAVRRKDLTEGESYWMRGMKTFASVEPRLPRGGSVSTRRHPIQSFQWADYTAKAGHAYAYTVVPLYGEPADPREGAGITVEITTEVEDGAPHSVYFNRGAVASQEYARRFQNRDPEEIGAPAYTWLSRGLFEAFDRFVRRAKGPEYGLHGAVYELQWPGALESIKAAKRTGASVKVLYDAIPGGKGPAAKNAAAIRAAGISALCLKRTSGRLMHNKFFVLTKNQAPIAVWTGSTNLTENGIFGHSNCAHVVEDGALAGRYLDYWMELASNPEAKAERSWVEAHDPTPPRPWNANLSAVFSPRSGLEALKRYAEMAGAAERGLFMTFAFGMHPLFRQVYSRQDDVLRFALMEKEGNGAGLAEARKDIRKLRRSPGVVVAVGNAIKLNRFDRWLAERSRVTKEAHVLWIHTKFMLVDPLGPAPVLVTGSANFSEASTTTNNENMIVIRSDTRVVDIYFTEYMRMFSHYAFREAAAFSPDWNPSDLAEDDGWQKDYFSPGSQRCRKREYFAG